MAKDDPQSSLAEDRAYERWANDTGSREAAKFFALEDRDELWEHIYRQGFRAGREHGRQNPAGRLERAIRERRTSNVSPIDATAYTLGELNARIDRVDHARHFGEGELRGYNQELERTVVRLTMRVEELEGDVKHAVEEEGLLRRIEALERGTELQWRCLRGENSSELRTRIEALEERLGLDDAEARAEREDRLREEQAHCDRLNTLTNTPCHPEDEDL